MADKPRVKDVKNSGRVQPGDIYNYLTKDKGLSHNHALGMLANINTESAGFQHSVVGDNGNAIGLFQHNGPRKAALLKYVNGNTSDWKKQIDFALSEKDSKGYLSKEFATPEAATEDFMVKWERPGDKSKEAIAGRIKYLSEFGNGIYATPGYQGSGDASTFEYDYNSNPLITDVEHFNMVNSQDYSVKAASFKEALAIEKEKEKKVETEPETQELTAAQKEYNNRISFLNTFNQTEDEAPKQVAVDETQSSPINPNLYAANTNIEIADQTTPLFSTTLNLPETTQEFKDGGIQGDGMYTHSGHNYKKIDGKWYMEPVENSGKYKLIEQGDVKARIAELERNAKQPNVSAQQPKNTKTIHFSSKEIESMGYDNKKEDSAGENVFEFIDPTGISSWDDVSRAYDENGLFNPKTALEILGALPLVGKIGKSGKVLAGGEKLFIDAVKYFGYNDKVAKAYNAYRKVGGKDIDDALGLTTKGLVATFPKLDPTKWASSENIINGLNKFTSAAKSTKLFPYTPSGDEDDRNIKEFGDGGRKQSLADLTIGEEYHYQGRPNKSYKLTDKGTWLIKDTKSKDGWKPIVDPTGERSATLERTVIPKAEYINRRQEALQKEIGLIKGQGNTFRLDDNRTIRATTGNPINPNVDLMHGEYSEDVVKEIITKAREKGVDPKTALAIALQESHLGKMDPNLGHSDIGDLDPYGYMDILKSKMALAKSKGHTNEEMQLQFYNGTGKLFPGTEAGYHGFQAGKFYGVPVTSSGLDLMKNPLYGKQVIDLRDNVISKSPHIDSLLKVKNFGDGGTFLEDYMAEFGDGGKKSKVDDYKILPETFNYEGRPGARYRRDNYGNWLVADRNTNGEFVAVKDASGARQAELNRRAVSADTGKTVNEYAKKEVKDPQKRFEQEAWNDYDKLSTSEKVLDRVKAAMVDPIGMTSRLITGEQAYIPGMGNGLLNSESENYDKYLKSVGYTPGKFEASDVQNILNPMYWGASAGNQLNKGNTAQGLVEAGLAFAGAGQGKNMLQGVKYLADDVAQGSRALKNASLPTYKNIYRVEPTTFAKDAADELSGRWMGSLEEMPYYVRNLKDPEAGIRIIRQKMPTKQWEAISGHNMPENAKLMSAGTGDYKTFQEAVDAGEISREAGSRISNNAYTTSDMAELSSNPRLINLTEGIVSDELINKLRYEKPRRFFPTRDLVEYPAGDLGKEGAMDHIFNVRGDVEKPILGIPRQYFPFREGGVSGAMILDSLLDQNNINEFKQKYGL